MSDTSQPAGGWLPDEAVAAGHGASRPPTRSVARASRRDRLGGTEGNEILTGAVAAVLTVLLAVEGVTLLRMDRLLREHMFIGIVLVGPIALKLASTGYRFARYYTGARAYREKGPPLPALRLLAPVLVLTTVVILATGVWLMVLGHRNDTALFLHKDAFIVWSAAFAVHFLAYLPRMLRSLRADWSTRRRAAVPGAGLRGTLVAVALGVGLALAVAVVPLITGWQGFFGFG